MTVLIVTITTDGCCPVRLWPIVTTELQSVSKDDDVLKLIY